METALHLDRIPANVWREYVQAIQRTGLTHPLNVALDQLQFLFSLSPVDVEKYFQERRSA
jgi:hypothetical protein